MNLSVFIIFLSWWKVYVIWWWVAQYGIISKLNSHCREWHIAQFHDAYWHQQSTKYIRSASHFIAQDHKLGPATCVPLAVFFPGDSIINLTVDHQTTTTDAASDPRIPNVEACFLCVQGWMGKPNVCTHEKLDNNALYGNNHSYNITFHELYTKL